jgi:dihydrodipicolinate synthase/N-acetylneuraminate lyase
MKTTFSAGELSGSVIAVPPLCRDRSLRIDSAENAKLIRHMEAGGVRTLLYGGNANFYSIAPSEFEAVLDVIEAAAGPETVIIPSVGPYFGTMMDQAAMLVGRAFPTVMILPTVAVSTPEGVRVAAMKFADRLARPVVLYLKDEHYVTVAVARALVEAGVVSWIKYAVVRSDPSVDPLLGALCDVIDPRMIVSGMGEQPALDHARHFRLGGFTTGCGCVAPTLSTRMLEALRAGEWEKAESIRAIFRLLEDLRNAHGPIAVLHHAVASAGIAETGPLLPLLAPLGPELQRDIARAARALGAIRSEAVAAM